MTKVALPVETLASGFEFPRIYSFKPFFTPQQNAMLWDQQMKQWTDLVLKYCAYHRIFKLHISPECTSLDLFCNKNISRKVSLDFLEKILAYMVANGSAMYESQLNNEGLLSILSFTKTSSKTVYIFFKTPEDLARQIYEWVDSTGQLGSVLTLEEIQAGGDAGAPFAGIDMEVLKMALRILEKQGKCQVFSGVDELGQGVKFK